MPQEHNASRRAANVLVGVADGLGAGVRFALPAPRQHLLVLEQLHAVEVGSSPREAVPALLVEATGTLEQLRRAQGYPRAALLPECAFGPCQQLLGDAIALRRGAHCHASQAAFTDSDDLAGDRSQDHALVRDGDEHGHLVETPTKLGAVQDRVAEGLRCVPLSVGPEGGQKAAQDSVRVGRRGAANRVLFSRGHCRS